MLGFSSKNPRTPNFLRRGRKAKAFIKNLVGTADKNNNNKVLATEQDNSKSDSSDEQSSVTTTDDPLWFVAPTPTITTVLGPSRASSGLLPSLASEPAVNNTKSVKFRGITDDKPNVLSWDHSFTVDGSVRDFVMASTNTMVDLAAIVEASRWNAIPSCELTVPEFDTSFLAPGSVMSLDQFAGRFDPRPQKRTITFDLVPTKVEPASRATSMSTIPSVKKVSVLRRFKTFVKSCLKSRPKSPTAIVATIPATSTIIEDFEDEFLPPIMPPAPFGLDTSSDDHSSSTDSTDRDSVCTSSSTSFLSTLANDWLDTLFVTRPRNSFDSIASIESPQQGPQQDLGNATREEYDCMVSHNPPGMEVPRRVVGRLSVPPSTPLRHRGPAL